MTKSPGERSTHIRDTFAGVSFQSPEDRATDYYNAIVHLCNSSYGLIEIKLDGDKLIEKGAESLKAIQDEIASEKIKSPSFLMVLTGLGDYAYRRGDGVNVVPVGAQKTE